jgi:carboxypeptidase T
MLSLQKSPMLFVLFFLFFSFNSSASLPNNYFVKLKAKNKLQRSKIAQLIHIDQVLEDNIYAVVNELEFNQLKFNIPDMLVEHHIYNTKNSSLPLTNIIEFPDKDKKYHTYKETIHKLKDLHKKYPKISELFSIGTSIDGRDLLGIRIFNQSLHKKDDFVPGILFTGAHHAREHLSVEIPLMISDHILNNYSTNSKIKELVNSRDIYIIPMINPDGAMHDIVGQRYKLWRKNRRDNKDGNFGVDLNRNYAYGWGTGGSSSNTGSNIYMGPKPFSEPETLGVKQFVQSKDNLRIFLSYHTYSELILYPWGGKYSGIGGQDEDVHRKMAVKMSSWNNYKPQQSSDLYVASGDTCDWAYGEHGLFCFTFELSPKFGFGGAGFYPGANIIDKVFQDNINPALYLIEKAGNPYSVLD